MRNFFPKNGNPLPSFGNFNFKSSASGFQHSTVMLCNYMNLMAKTKFS
jgi:hypothetical protein